VQFLLPVFHLKKGVNHSKKPKDYPVAVKVIVRGKTDYLHNLLSLIGAKYRSTLEMVGI
jgi:hypothetical protein